MFGNDNPVVIEIGFGRGNATAQIAAGNPGVNYLGIEVFTGGVGHLLGEIRRLGLANLRIIEGDALELLAGRVPDGSVAGFHLFFPDPWPKKRHHKRRLLRRPRTDLLAAKLTPGGGICFVTDIADYALSARAELDATPGLANRFPGFAPRQTWRPETRFEAKGTAQGREPLELVYEKRPESACIPTG
jgi:tRNA (guanine-N7-)-methyltransferase